LAFYLQRGASAFADPQKFGCYITADPSNEISVNTALRYWGCAIQAGANILGAFGVAAHQSSIELVDIAKRSFSPLPFALIPNLPKYSSVDWGMILLDSQTKDARNLLYLPAEKAKTLVPSVKFDSGKRCITLFMPGFDKSEIKLYQVGYSSLPSKALDLWISGCIVLDTVIPLKRVGANA